MVLVLPFTSSSSTVVLLLSDDSCQQRPKTKVSLASTVTSRTRSSWIHKYTVGGATHNHTTMIDQLKHKPARGYIGGHVVPSENIGPVCVDIESH